MSHRDDYDAPEIGGPKTFTATFTATIEGSIHSFANGHTPFEVDVGMARTVFFDQHSTPPKANIHPGSHEYSGKDLTANSIVITEIDVIEHQNNLPGTPAIGVSIPSSANLSRLETHGVVKPSGHAAALHVINSQILLKERNVYRFRVAEVTEVTTLKNAMHGAESHLDRVTDKVQLWESHPLVKACQTYPDLFGSLGLTEMLDNNGQSPMSIDDCAVDMKDHFRFVLDKSFYDKAVKALDNMPSSLPVENVLTDLKVRFEPICGKWETLPKQLPYEGNKEFGILPKFAPDELDRASTIGVTFRIKYIIPTD